MHASDLGPLPVAPRLGDRLRNFAVAQSLRDDERVVLADVVPFALMHLACLGALVTGARPVDWAVCAGLYFLRMFGITAGYHRYFAHRSFKAGRGVQFVLALLGTLSAQKGVLWWAGHHRNHHRFSDTDEDIHSPVTRGFWWSHMGWILCRRFDATPDTIKDFARFPEIRWLDRHYLVPPTALALAVLAALGWSGLFVGFFLSTVLLYHGTFTINSLSHVFGRRRYATTDDSRNNALLALITMGEGWHNNHHYYQSAARMGFFWWELDLSWLVLRALASIGLVHDLRQPSRTVLESNRIDRPNAILAPIELPHPGAAIAEGMAAARSAANDLLDAVQPQTQSLAR